MPAIFDLLYREYCRARLAEMRKQLLISPERHEIREATYDAKDAVGASPNSYVGGGGTATQHEVLKHQLLPPWDRQPSTRQPPSKKVVFPD
jgi:hypothetical protein